MLQMTIEEIVYLKKAQQYINEQDVPDKVSYGSKFALLFDGIPLVDDKDDEIILADFFKMKRNNRGLNPFSVAALACFAGDIEQLRKCCRKAHLCTHTFNKICEGAFSPSKAAVCSFVFAGEFDIEAANQLFSSAKFPLCRYNKFDLAIMFFLENRIYDFAVINKILYLLDLPLLGYYFA